MTARIGVASVLILGAWTLGGAMQVPAFAPRWQEKALISVWVDPEDAPPRALEMVARAVKTWSAAGQGHVALGVTTIERDAKVRVRFINDRRRYGETAPHLDRTGTIVSAAIVINASSSGDQLQRSIIVYLTALHELGHALGLAHTDSFGDIMYAFRAPEDGDRYFGAFRRRVSGLSDIGTSRATGLSQDDVAALRKLYTQ